MDTSIFFRKDTSTIVELRVIDFHICITSSYHIIQTIMQCIVSKLKVIHLIR